MAHSFHHLRSALLACSVALTQIAFSEEPLVVVFQNGSSIPVSSITRQGTNLVVTVPIDGYSQGQVFPLTSADHIYGERPPAVNQAIALLLWGNPKEALKLLEPVVVSQRSTSSITGNFWLEAARASLVAYAVSGDSNKVTEIGKEISDATPVQGSDPFVALGKALLLPSVGAAENRLIALQDLATGSQPADVSAYASFYRAQLLIEKKRDAEALEAYLSAPCLFPSGGLSLNAASEIKAAELLMALTRRDEAVALLKSSLNYSAGTVLAAEATKRLESSK